MTVVVSSTTGQTGSVFCFPLDWAARTLFSQSEMILKVLVCFCAAHVGAYLAADPKNVVDPDAFRNVSQLIASKGYPVEEYEIRTPDGYILGLQRIPRGATSNQVPGTNKPVVYLHHGSQSLSDDWVMNMPNQSLGFILADSGYDVWLGNSRGNKYSRKHVTLSPDSKEFWQYPIDPLALVDLPATLDFILNATAQSKLFYVGHSLGTTLALGLLSDRPDYNDKIQTAFLLGPAATLTYAGQPFKFLDLIKDIKLFMAKVFGHGEIKGASIWTEILTEVLCNKEVEFCDNLYFAVSGMSLQQLNQTRVPVYLSNHPAGASVMCAEHMAQVRKSGLFRKFDYGEEENMIKYNQTTPPEYPVENITTPIVLMWGLNDHVTDPVDVNLLALRIKNLLLNYQVPYPVWGHVDFILALEARKYVYDEILSIIKQQIMKERF